MSALKKIIFTAFLFFTAAFSSLSAYAPPGAWQKISDLPVSPSEVRSLLPHPEHEALLFASRNRIFQKESSGRWEEIWRLPGIHNEIKKIIHAPEIPGKLFALTREGIYLGDLSSGKWRLVFSGPGRAKDVLSFAVLRDDPEQWFAGTVSGLFETDDAGKTWDKIEHAPRAPVTAIAFSRERLYAAFGNQIYVSPDLESFKPVLGLPYADKKPELVQEETAPIDFEESTTQTSQTFFYDMTADPSSGEVWAASRKGIFATRDRGKRWDLLPSAGLRSADIRFLAYSLNSRRLFAAGTKEVYVYNSAAKRWEELFQGMSRGTFYGLFIAEDEEKILSLTSSGVLQLSVEFPEAPVQISIPNNHPAMGALVKRWISLEPTAREVQKAAAEYSNLKNGKINRWHAGSRLAALLPNVSFGKDFSTSNNIDLDRGGTSDRDTFIAGPDDTNRGWDFDVSWDLGDFFYSSAQTSIDSREKIMAEFRHEMLSEATRLYYERRRLQMEFMTVPPQNEEEHADLVMRIDELTALLDGMTGGRFGKKLEKIEAKYPELAEIWVYRESVNS